MGKIRLNLVERKVLKELLEAGTLTAEAKQLGVGATLCLLRKYLHMTQAQLAKRSGVAQASIAKIEAGKLNASLQVLERLFGALYCRFTVLPLPKTPLERIVVSQATKLAKKRSEYLAGTLALEDQLPDKEVMDSLLEEDIRQLIDTGSSEIWDV